MISEYRAKLVLENPDGCHEDDLAEVILWAYTVPIAEYAKIILPYKDVIKYIHFLLIARLYREKGDINKALEFEKICQRIYDKFIPKDKRW